MIAEAGSHGWAVGSRSGLVFSGAGFWGTTAEPVGWQLAGGAGYPGWARVSVGSVAHVRRLAAMLCHWGSYKVV